MLFLEHVPGRLPVPPVSSDICVDIPESPMGEAVASSIALAAYLRGLGFSCVLPHVRVCDLNKLALLSVARAARAIGAWGLLITYGDPPAIGSCTNAFNSSKDAIEFLHSHMNSPPRLGAVLSLRYPIRDVIDRLKIPADFFLVLRLGESTWDKFVTVAEEASALGKVLIPYVIVETESNRELLAALNQPVIGMSELGDWVGKICRVVGSALLSLPEASKVEIVEAVETAKAQCFGIQKR